MELTNYRKDLKKNPKGKFILNFNPGFNIPDGTNHLSVALNLISIPSIPSFSSLPKLLNAIGSKTDFLKIFS